ncbi:MAG: hypothetical protein B6D58_06575 [candidate division Zixibacteria bacterium 4484_95]|nr:MAG: hypothetical protein B6D58_06575 [candidate division Zixibacteria bacterium 4484_95]
MTTGQLILNGIAAFLTLCIFSFLYKDNPFYKFAERLVAGVATGYWTILLYHTNFTDKVIEPIFINGQYHYIIPAVLGIMMWTRFSRKWSWISRYPIAFYIGIGSGVSITVYLYTYLFKQLQATISTPLTLDLAGLNVLIIVIAVLSALIYFFFSSAHKGIFNVASRFGIYVIMIGFGAGFGLTVMGRVALLVQRIIFLRDYIVALFGG